MIDLLVGGQGWFQMRVMMSEIHFNLLWRLDLQSFKHYGVTIQNGVGTNLVQWHLYDADILPFLVVKERLHFNQPLIKETPGNQTNQ